MLDVLVVVEFEKLDKLEVFEAHLAKRSIKSIEGEPFAYYGSSETDGFATRTYVIETIKEALKLVKFESLKLVLQIGDFEMERLLFDKFEGDFIDIA